MIYTWLYQLYW